MGAPRVAVLLAAYNGMGWLSAQVESIFGQAGVHVTIFASIDLSCDGTEAWFENYSKSEPRIKVLPTGLKFGGAAKNFFRLIKDVDFSEFDYIAFSDQDDLWKEDKLLSAHRKIFTEGYAAYSGNVIAFWPDGRERLINKAQPQKAYDFLFEAAGPGCTYVLRSDAALQLKKFVMDNWVDVNMVSLHDWLIYAWYRANGLHWYIDSIPRMLYRQHAGNQVGANMGLKAIKRRLSLLYSGWYRNEVSKISNLVGPFLQDDGGRPAKQQMATKYFIFSHFNQLRRSLRDRIFLVVIAALNLY